MKAVKEYLMILNYCVKCVNYAKEQTKYTVYIFIYSTLIFSEESGKINII